MENKKTHWKVFHNPEYLGAYSFQPNERKILTISKTTRESVKNQKGNDNCVVIHFKQNIKPMICNVTNSKAISKVTGSSYLEDWVGHDIEIFVSKTDAFGEKDIECIRVKPSKPISNKKETLSPESDRWLGAVQSVINGKISIEKIKSTFYIADEHVKLLETSLQLHRESNYKIGENNENNKQI